MTVYYINLLLILALAFPLCIYKPNTRKKAAYLLITFSWMWFIATFRYNIGFDYYNYVDIFDQIRGLSSVWDVRYEPGFVLLTRAMTLFIHDYVVMYGVYQILIMVPVMWFIYRYCKNVWLAVWLYATLTFFYISMNFTRQALACSITLLGYKFLRERKIIPYMLIVLLAGSFHFTALIMIPIYFVCNLQLTKRLAIFYGAATFALYFTAPLILDLVTRFVFTGYRDSIYVTESLGLRYMLVPISILATCLILLPAWKKRDSDAVMLTNMMVYSTIIWLFVTRIFIVQRFAVYPEILMLIALPAAIGVLLPFDEDYSALKALQAALPSRDKKKKTAEQKMADEKIEQLQKSIKDRNIYYWSAVGAVIIVTLIYHSLGVNMGFHNVFPYQSVLGWGWL